MQALGWFFAAAGVGIGVANVRTMGPLWRSPGLERSQKVAQTVLMWLLPGSYLFVRQVVMTPGAAPPVGPTQSSNLDDYSSGSPGEYLAPHPHHQGWHSGDGGGHHDAGFGHDGGGADGGGADGGGGGGGGDGGSD